MSIIRWMLVSIVAIRTFVAVAATIPSLSYIFYDRSYHVYYGAGLMILSVLAKRFFWSLREAALGIGLGLFFDDIAVLLYVVLGPPADPIGEYWSWIFIVPLLSGVLLVTFLHKQFEMCFRRE